ncbi:MAG TPA: 2-oxoacid:acceptor oxidoreductase subunit alpha [Vicinamibacteria bacterium]|nr:2-oxoacid:acceptor oxidoreductase subunit alpha [Vicinamibacteria bacterium]
MATEITVGIAGAAGDGLDRTGDTLARTAARLGLHLFTYNSYQSLIRGGHTWLRLRLSEAEAGNHGDHLNVLIALNDDSLERHARDVEKGGAIVFNSSRFKCHPSLVPEGVRLAPLPVAEITAGLGKLPAVMQNTAALGALLHLAGLDLGVTEAIVAETFSRKGDDVIRQNAAVLRAGYAYAAANFPALGYRWTFTRRARPVVTGNLMTALGAVAAGCKFYSAYPMSPASFILHWLAAHSEKLGVVVKQAEDELAVVNLAIGAGHAGVRSMCATSGGGFALMSEAIGMAGMIETPVVIVNVQRGGPSTGLPTKSEQGDLNQALGASQGDYPRVIVAPRDATDCFHTAVEAMNLAESFQLPVIVISDLLLGEHRSTLDPERISHQVPIERGEWAELGSGDGFKRYALTASGVSPRARPGQPGAMHVAATDDHDEKGILISDEHTNAAIRRKMHEKRMRKMELVKARLSPPALEGPAEADVTLIGWGSTASVIREAAAQLTAAGVRANQLHFKYLHPFHGDEARRILAGCKRSVVVEGNFTGQFARHLRAECGVSVDHVVTRYDGEPFEPAYIARRVRAFLEGRPMGLAVEEHEAREMAYHYIRLYMQDKARPLRFREARRGHPEPVWEVELVGRSDGRPEGTLVIGMDTGSVYGFSPAREGASALAAERSA